MGIKKELGDSKDTDQKEAEDEKVTEKGEREEC